MWCNNVRDICFFGSLNVEDVWFVFVGVNNIDVFMFYECN